MGGSHAFKHPDWFAVEAVMLPSANHRGVRVEDMTYAQLAEAVQVLGRDLKHLSLAKHAPLHHSIVEREIAASAAPAEVAFKACRNPVSFVVETVIMPSAGHRPRNIEDMNYMELAEAVQVLGQDLKRMSLLKRPPVRYLIVEKPAAE